MEAVVACGGVVINKVIVGIARQIQLQTLLKIIGPVPNSNR